MNSGTIILAGIILIVVLAVRPKRKRKGHSWFYEWYIKSSLWKFRRWLWYWTSRRRCEKCNAKLVLHAKDVGRFRRRNARTMTVHHKTYRRLGHEHRRDVQLLCWPCHSARDAWKHKR